MHFYYFRRQLPNNFYNTYNATGQYKVHNVKCYSGINMNRCKLSPSENASSNDRISVDTHHLVVDGLRVSDVVVGGVVREYLVLPLRVAHLHRAALGPHAYYLYHTSIVYNVYTSPPRSK